MRSALANDQPLNFRPADRTRLARPTVDTEMVLEFSAAKDPVYTGTVVFDALLQSTADGAVQLP
jgi:hypothetical protein